MNIIYKLYNKIEEHFLEKYFVEIEFYTSKSKSLVAYNKNHNTLYSGDYKCYLPIIFMVKNMDELESLINIITNTLKEKYDCSINSLLKPTKITSDNDINVLTKKTELMFKGYKKSILNIKTMTPKSFDTKDIIYKERDSEKEIRIMKIDPKMLTYKFDFTVMFVKPTTEE
jgi:hypothetical protein